MKAIGQHFHVVLFIMHSVQVVLSVNKTFVRDLVSKLNKSYGVYLSSGPVCFRS